MSEREVRDYIEDVVSQIEKIEEFVSNISDVYPPDILLSMLDTLFGRQKRQQREHVDRTSCILTRPYDVFFFLLCDLWSFKGAQPPCQLKTQC